MVNPYTSAAGVSKYKYNPRDEGYHVAHAMLAMAYEQETANLIAWVNSGKCYISDIPALSAEINKRLGLNE